MSWYRGASRFFRQQKRLVFLLISVTVLCWLLFESKFAYGPGSEFSSGRELLQQQSFQRIVDSATSTTSRPSNPVVAVDKSAPKNESVVVQNLQDQLPNLPIVYLESHKNQVNKKKTCSKFPSLYDIHFNNIYWQQTDTKNGTFFLYGAYYDVRALNKAGAAVRILSMINRMEPSVKTFCQLWFEGSDTPSLAKVESYRYVWVKKWGNNKANTFQPYLLTCRIPKDVLGKVPISVSIVENQCELPTNNLRVIYNKPESGKKKPFAVCVKGLDFPTQDLSVRIVEWIELLHSLGADKVYMYNLETHPNITKVLDYYVQKGVVDLTPISLPGYQPNMPHLQHMYLKKKLGNKRQNELIPYNDCLYRNMYRYEYIALLDIDEIIMPIKHDGWSSMMKELVKASKATSNKTKSSFSFRNVYFFDGMDPRPEDEESLKEIPEYLHMARHIYRSVNYTKPGHYVKCFHNPEYIMTIHNHYPLSCFENCSSFSVSTDIGHLQHYRSDCVKGLKKSCDSVYKNYTVTDTTIWRWKDKLIAKTTDSLNNLGFFKVDNKP